MIARRKLLLALGTGALAAPLACFAQQQRSKVARIGLLMDDLKIAKALGITIPQSVLVRADKVIE